MSTPGSARPWWGAALLAVGLGISGCSSPSVSSQGASEQTQVPSSPKATSTSTPQATSGSVHRDSSNAESSSAGTATPDATRSGESEPKKSKASSQPAPHVGQKKSSKDRDKATRQPVADVEGTGGTRGPNQQALLKSIAGPSSSTCVTVNSSQRTVRSGSMAASDFVEARNQFKAQSKANKAAKVYLVFIPEHAGKNATLKVTVTSSQGKSKTVTSKNVGNANGWTYYGARVPVASPGVWQFKATVGSDTGCFRVSFAG